MSSNGQDYETPKWRTFWMMLGFAVLVGIGIVTVLRPELQNKQNEQGNEAGAVEQPETDATLQE